VRKWKGGCELRIRRSLESREPWAGNYFVSAYPPFACWNEAGIESFCRSLDRPAPSNTPLVVYVHVPFCIKRCQYCYYLSYDDRFQEMDRYLGALTRELALYAEKTALLGRKVSSVYFGGGTPSLLSRPRIRRLMEDLQEIFPWSDAREVTFECAPRSVTEAKLGELRDAGVTRISLGVQQLDDEVLRQNGRVHLVHDVERTYEAARCARFEMVNMDLMVGLVAETDGSFLKSLDRVIDLSPECVTIYQLEVPFNTPLYRAIRDGEQSSMPAPWETKRERLKQGMVRLEEAGYRMRSAYTAVRDPERHRFVYQDEQYRGADLLGLGVSSFSYVGGVHQQNRTSLREYLEIVEGGELPQGRGYALSGGERLVREFVLQLKLGAVDAGRFREKFGAEVTESFRRPLTHFQELGWLTLEEDQVRLTREGLLRVDGMIPAFYLPEHSSG